MRIEPEIEPTNPAERKQADPTVTYSHELANLRLLREQQKALADEEDMAADPDRLWAHIKFARFGFGTIAEECLPASFNRSEDLGYTKNPTEAARLLANSSGGALLPAELRRKITAVRWIRILTREPKTQAGEPIS